MRSTATGPTGSPTSLRPVERRSQPAPAANRPDHHEGASDDALLVDGSKDSTIHRLRPIVAENEHLLVGNEHRGHVGLATAGDQVGLRYIALGKVGLFENLPVDVDDAGLDRNRLAREGDDPFDEVVVLDAATIRRDTVEDNHVTTTDVTDLVGQLVDEHTVRLKQSGLHGGTGNVELLQDEGTDSESDEKRHDKHDNPVANRTERLGAPASSRGHGTFAGQFIAHPSEVIRRHIDSMIFSTLSSRLLKGSLHKTVRCAWSFNFRCTQSTV